jgi:peptidoglycan/xylan/chitin deacetylase (PgdA/CDA1 family)
MKRLSIISNLCIAVVLIGIGFAVFSADLSNVFLSVSAPVYNGDRTAGNVSLMFEVEENSGFFPEIIQVLKDNNASATFFVGGRWASKNQTLIREIAEDFEIANHAYSNSVLTNLSEKNQLKEIRNCHNQIKMITAGTKLDIENGNKIQNGVTMKLFLPPYGSFNKTTLKCAEKLGYKTVIWSKDATGEQVFEKATNNVQSGDFVLLRPSAATLGALPGIFEKYQELMLKVVAVSENIA